MEPSVRCALVQMAPALGLLRSNLERHLEWLQTPEARQADLVVFPELSLTGYLLQDLVAEVALPVTEGGFLKPLVEASRERDVVVGLVEQSPQFLFHNTALYLSGGRILHAHRKVYLPTYGMFDEGRYFAPGASFEAFETRFGRMGLLICEDAWHLSAPYLLALQGAHTLLVTAGSPGRGLAVSGSEAASVRTWERVGQTLSQFLTTHWVYVNRVGYEDGLAFAGGSYVSDPFGDLLLDGDENREAVYRADLDLGRVRRARTLTPLLRDEKPELVLRHLERLVSRAGAPDRSGP
ncbi:MAG: nitrilase-related carbon-nitrogen hydrolase [Acidobacteriota bacterium]